jgi:hypothetical protein
MAQGFVLSAFLGVIRRTTPADGEVERMSFRTGVAIGATAHLAGRPARTTPRRLPPVRGRRPVYDQWALFREFPSFIKKVVSLWRVRGRRTRPELKHFRRRVMTCSLLEPHRVNGRRGAIRDGRVLAPRESAGIG